MPRSEPTHLEQWSGVAISPVPTDGVERVNDVFGAVVLQSVQESSGEPILGIGLEIDFF